MPRQTYFCEAGSGLPSTVSNVPAAKWKCTPVAETMISASRLWPESSSILDGVTPRLYSFSRLHWKRHGCGAAVDDDDLLVCVVEVLWPNLA